MKPVAEALHHTDPRALKGVSQVVGEVLHDPSRIDELVRAMEHEDAVVRMRAGDAAEKVSRNAPHLLAPHKALLLRTAATTEQASLRWHLAQIIPRLVLDATERRAAIVVLKRYLDDASAIVKTCAMQALADLALADRSLRRTVLPALQKATETGTAAMRSRGVRLLEALEPRKTKR